MAGEELFSLTRTHPLKDKTVNGVAPAIVIDNVDCTGEARVQIRLPWLPGVEPWARVATPMAGMGRGTYFIPQVGDEVLVAFHHGDVREPYIVGSLWNTTDRPPALAPTDAITKRVIRTPSGHEVTFDEALQSVTISNTTRQTLALDPAQAQLAGPPGTGSVTVSATGHVTIEAAAGIVLKAPLIKLDGTSVQITGTANASLGGGAQCTITGVSIDIG